MNLYPVGQVIAAVLISDSLMRFLLVLIRFFSRPRSKTVTVEVADGEGCVILIAAHNESGTIGETVRSFNERLAEWPLSEVWVVADRCQDSTADEARREAANVAVRVDGRVGKGAVIDWWLRTYQSVWVKKDAILILDADSRLEAGSLKCIRDEFKAGAKVIQSFVAPVAGSESGRLAGWSEVIMQRVDDEARSRCGWPVPLRGTGMAFRGEILAELAPRLHTLAEDLELDVLLCSAGVPVTLVSGSVVLDPKPIKSDGAARQRARWLHGQIQVLLAYPRELLAGLFKGGPGAWLLILLLFLRPKILFIGIRVILIFIFPKIALTGLTMDLSYYLAGAFFVEKPASYLLDLISAPRYLFMWMRSFGIALFRRSRKVWLKAGR